MKVKDIIELLDLEVIVGADLDREITGGYAGDLLSNVMAGAEAGNVWITIQSHQNVVAVGLLVDISAVIIAENFEVEEKALKRAREKGINILRSSLSAYEIAGILYQKGIKT